MSTKNLARTVIEGGRYRGNRWLRRYSNSQERAAERQLSSRIAHIDDIDDVAYVPRKPVWRDFHDKLASAERWIRSQVGRPWNKVRGELMRRFDTRTTAGRHIVFDHLIPSVQVEDIETRFGYCDFKVDRHGILRELKPRRLRRTVPHLPEPEYVLVDWLGGRRVGERGAHLYWFAPTPGGAFRQGRALDEADAARWRSLPDWFRQRWDAFAVRMPERTH